jgi:hypothetical protein
MPYLSLTSSLCVTARETRATNTLRNRTGLDNTSTKRLGAAQRVNVNKIGEVP